MKRLIVCALLLAATTGCRMVKVEVIAYPGSSVWIDGVQQQADKPMDIKGGGLSIPLGL